MGGFLTALVIKRDAKLKPQWDTIRYLLKWIIFFESLIIPNAGEHAKWQGFSFIANKNLKW